MAKREQDVKATQAIKTEATELFQPLSDQKAETVKGGGGSCLRTTSKMLSSMSTVGSSSWW